MAVLQIQKLAKGTLVEIFSPLMVYIIDSKFKQQIKLIIIYIFLCSAQSLKLDLDDDFKTFDFKTWKHEITWQVEEIESLNITATTNPIC